MTAPARRLDLFINEGFVPMIDGSLVYMRGFGDRRTSVDSPRPSLTIPATAFFADGRITQPHSYPEHAAEGHEGRPEPKARDRRRGGHWLIRRAHWASEFPARTILVETGSDVRLRIHNRLGQPHRFAIEGVVQTPPILPGQTRDVTFPAPEAGTYVYHDPTNAPVERVLGLFGVMMVIPARDRWRLTPGGVEFERQWLWLCHDVDPEWGRRAHAGERIDPTVDRPEPRYFRLNDKSGYDALGVTEDEERNHFTHEHTIIAGFPRDTDVRDFSKAGPGGSVATGQLVRLVNAGVVTHQMHFHGNHVWTLTRNGRHFPRTNGTFADGHPVLQAWEDVIELDPLDRKDVVLPIRRPPDVIDEVWEARTGDWFYPMHCHAEPSQTAAGGLYPGGLVAHWVLAGPVEGGHPTFPSQVAFATTQPKQSNPVTQHRVTPDVSMVRDFFNRRMTFPDGSEHEMWAFTDDSGGQGFPSTPVRVREGQVVHVELRPSKRAHTIHWHGIEPDPRNDGVGHTSFEVTGSYTYQWRPEEGVPGDPNRGGSGTFFYHCHVNTVLHVQMGMAGPMVVDPVEHPAFPVPDGARRSFVDGPLYDVATEHMLVPYALDPRWHELGHAAGLSGEDVGLNRFEPSHFFILGGNLADGPPREGVWSTDSIVVNAAGRGLPSLVRLLNLNYFPVVMTFENGSRTRALPIAELISHDGRPYRDTSSRSGSCPPVRARGRGHRMMTNRLAFGAAERYDVLLHPPAGRYTLRVDFHHWIPERERDGARPQQPRILATRWIEVEAR
jgi:FtsP/CotA-like multicopper oxidase with cupredoxin domain